MTAPRRPPPEHDAPRAEPGAPDPDIRGTVWVVLCRPVDPRNVGAAIRATVNHGLAGLRVVTTETFDPADLFHFSSGALDVCDLRWHRELTHALADCDRVVGSSRRLRDPLAPPCWPAAGLAERLAGAERVALLFGTERTGLSAAELDTCAATVHIPTSPRFASLNLAHAVACLGYELARPAPEASGPSLHPELSTGLRPDPAESRLRSPVLAREAFYQHVTAVAEALGYPPGRTAAGFTRKLRRLLDRANPSPPEFGLLAGVFSELRRLGAEKQGRPPEA